MATRAVPCAAEVARAAALRPAIFRLKAAWVRAKVPPGLSYETVDISLDVAALDQVRSLGYAQAPVVVAGGEHWSGFRPDKIKALAAGRQIGRASCRERV